MSEHGRDELSAGSAGLPRRSVAEVLADVRRGLDRLSPEEAARTVAAGGLLIDIRPQSDQAAEGVIPGAWIVDRNVLQWRLDPQCPHRLDEVDGSFYDRVLIVVCNEGYASSFAAQSLRDLGLTGATDLDGGYRAWVAAGLPSVRSELVESQRA